MMTTETVKDYCKYCDGETNCRKEIMAAGQHYAKLSCLDCGQFLRWLPKPQDDATKYRRPASSKELVKKFSEGYCRLCTVTENELSKFRGETLEAHHVIEVQDKGGDEEKNIWIVCTACHKMIHHQRNYRGRPIKSLVNSVIDSIKPVENVSANGDLF